MSPEEVILEKANALADAEKGVAIAIAKEIVPVEAVGEPVKEEEEAAAVVKKDIPVAAAGGAAARDDERRKWYIFAGVFAVFCFMAAIVIAVPMRHVVNRSPSPISAVDGSSRNSNDITSSRSSEKEVESINNQDHNETERMGHDNGKDTNTTAENDSLVGNAEGESVNQGQSETAQQGQGNGTDTNTTFEDELFVSIQGPFPTTVRLFSPAILDGYANVQELEADLVNVSWFMINNVYRGNLVTPCWQSRRCGPIMGDIGFEPIGSVPVAAPRAPGNTAGMDRGGTPRGGTLRGGTPRGGTAPEARDETANTNSNDKDDSWRTNNQEVGVEEGDLIVSDGDKVYAAYGDYIVAWNARSGRMLSHVRMPSVERIVSEHRDAGSDNNATTGNGENNASLRDSRYFHGSPSIRSLLLHGDRLVVIVGGYGQALRKLHGRRNSILYDFMETLILVYDTSNLDRIAEQGNDTIAAVSEVPLLGSMLVNGGFNAVRSVGGNVHVVTTSGLDTRRDLQSPFDPRNFDAGLKDDEEYIAMVRKTAEEESIPNFVDGLVKELQAPTGRLPDLAKIAAWQSGGSSGSQLERRAFRDGLINNLVQVYSFDVMGEATPDDALLLVKEKVHVTGTFLPSNRQQVYGTPTDLILAGEGWEFDRWARSSSEGTYLMAFATDGATTKMRSVGHVPGRVLNSYSMDVVNSTLRIATTLRNMWVMRPIGTFDGPARDGRLQVERQSTTKNYVFSLDLEGTSSSKEEGEGTEGMITERGRLELGKPNEVFTSVRYFDNIAYAVTFERTDPFYVLNLTNPDAPDVLAELSITGFSSYLHSMNSDNTLILAIGQEADEVGRVLGVKITVFDARIPQTPVAIQNYVVEKDKDTRSGSEALSNFKAARYAGGRLVIPMDIRNSRKPGESFRGFSVFLVSESTIREECRISHDEALFRNSTNATNESRNGSDAVGEDGGALVEDFSTIGRRCYSCASLPRRSMMFDALMMTTDKHLVASTNTSVCQTQWIEPIVIKDPVSRCCGY